MTYLLDKYALITTWKAKFEYKILYFLGIPCQSSVAQEEVFPRPHYQVPNLQNVSLLVSWLLRFCTASGHVHMLTTQCSSTKQRKWIAEGNEYIQNWLGVSLALANLRFSKLTSRDLWIYFSALKS